MPTTATTHVELLRYALRGTSATTGVPVPRVLVLCRCAAQADALRRAVAATGGLPGVEVTTPRAFVLVVAGEAAQQDEREKPERPGETRLLRRVGAEGERPLLEAHVAAGASALRLHLAVGERLPLGLPDLVDLQEVAASGWGADEVEHAVCEVLAGIARRRGSPRPGPTDSASYDAVLSVGYPPLDAEGRWKPAPAWEGDFCRTWTGQADAAPLTPASAWERALLAALEAHPLLESSDRPAPTTIPAVEVPDVTAEARLAVRLALHAQNAGRSTLVLVPGTADLARLRAFGRGNELDMAEAEGVPMSQHPLAPVLNVAIAWFAPGPEGPVTDPLIRASHLDAVLCSPVVGRHFPRSMATALEATITARWTEVLGSPPEPGEALGWSVKERRAAIRACRINEAPLSRWALRTRDLLEAPPGDDPRRAFRTWRGALLLQARLERLAAFVTGAPAVMMGTARTDVVQDGGDLDLEGAEELDGEHQKQPPTHGTLGALRGFLLDLRVRVHNDPVGRSIAVALREASDKPATAANLREVLGGEGGGGRLIDGLEVQLYDEYDGRVCDEVLLLGVHDKGLGAAPSPDPVLSPAALRALGVGSPRDRTLFRMLQALRAASQGSVLAIVSRRDASGRAVVPPIEIPLSFAQVALPEGLTPGDLERDSFGLRLLQLPEIEQFRALQVESPIQNSPSPAGAEVELADLALQASAEWVRAGRGPTPEAPPAGAGGTGVQPTLADLLDRLAGWLPPALGPYLGEVDSLPQETGDDGLPKPWSVSKDVEPLANCLYRYFVERVLHILEDEPTGDELDPREVGNAVHSALEAANPQEGEGVRWRVPAADIVSARDRARALLGTTAETRMSDAHRQLGHTSPAVDAATAGLQARWKKHWGEAGPDGSRGYIASRIVSLEALETSFEKLIQEQISAMGPLDALVDEAMVLIDDWTLKDPSDRPKKVRSFFAWLLRRSAEGLVLAGITGPELKELASVAKTVPQGQAARLADVVGGPRFAAVAAEVAELIPALRARYGVLRGAQVAVEVELPFGDLPADWQRPGREALLSADLSLGGERLPVIGRIDRVLAIEGDEGPLLQVLDYKTGKPKKKKVLIEGLETLGLPQLPVYALVLRRLLAEGAGPIASLPAGSRVACLGYDHVRDPGAGGLYGDHIVDDAELDRLEDALGRLVARAREGRFWPVPLDEERHSWGYPRGSVPLKDAARFEALPTIPSLNHDASDEEGEE